MSRLRSTISRTLFKACGALLLMLLSASVSEAAHAPRQVGARLCDARGQSTSIRKLIRQMRAVGGPLARKVRLARLTLAPRTIHFQRSSRAKSYDSYDAIQNDAPAAQSAVDPIVEPARLVAYLVDFEQQPFTLAFSPRSPRGPPASV